MNVPGDWSVGDPSGSKGKGKSFQHPTYAHLIHDAISTLKQRGGSSAAAIRKNIELKMGPSLGPNYKKIVGSTISKLAKNGKLIRTGNTFKLSPEFKQELGLKKKKQTTAGRGSSSGRRKAIRRTVKKQKKSRRTGKHVLKLRARVATRRRAKTKRNKRARKSRSTKRQSRSRKTKKSSASSSPQYRSRGNDRPEN